MYGYTWENTVNDMEAEWPLLTAYSAFVSFLKFDGFYEKGIFKMSPLVLHRIKSVL